MSTTKWRKGWEDLSSDLWKDICSKFPPKHEHREVFQLLAASYFYHVNAVSQIPKDRLHKVFAVSRHEKGKEWNFATFSNLFSLCSPPHFSEPSGDIGEKDFFGTMHLSSASFRLSTALTLASRLGIPSLSSFLTAVDWNRHNLTKYLEKAAGLNCLAEFPKKPTDEQIAIYTTMLVAHRDEFGHGERGEKDSGWIGARENSFSKIKCCRIIEAQLHLTRIGLASVKKLTQ